MLELSSLNFDKGNGLVTVVAQDASTGAVLMVAYADRVALVRTLETGEMHYHSRTRGQWHKGETSGNIQKVVSLSPDCDGDAVLARVSQLGPACHTGKYSCFGVTEWSSDVLRALDATIAQRASTLPSDSAPSKPVGDATGDEPRPKPSYTQRLLRDRNLRLKKIGEESGELIAACADSNAARAVEEAADLVYHIGVALHAVGATLDDVRRVLGQRSTNPAPPPRSG